MVVVGVGVLIVAVVVDCSVVVAVFVGGVVSMFVVDGGKTDDVSRVLALS